MSSISATAEDQSLDSSDASRQCVLYYSNPNFLLEQQETTTLRFGIEEGSGEPAEDDDDDDDDDDDVTNNAVTSDVVMTTTKNNHLSNGNDPEERLSVDDLELDLDLEAESYADYYDTDSISRMKASSGMRIRSRTFPHRFWITGYPDCGLGSVVTCLRSRPCMFFVYVFVVLVLLSSFVSVVLVGVLVAEPYSRVAGYRNATCRTRETVFAREEQSCSCGKGCNSRYRCLRIKVEYRDASTSAVHQAMLYEDETSLNRPCSFYPPCRSSRQENEDAVQVYERHFGIAGLEFDCWHSVTSPADVIQHKRFSLYHVISGVVWSVVVFVISLTILLVMLRKTGCFC